jgi:glycerol-3-phosphate cytidylyltransferase/D-beta-D-heptose 7-phosphate kinase/D-beta-D-heptose 1-phosphate adenosyltransferase
MTTPQRPAKASIVSGYFNPLHQGHLDMLEAAAERTGHLIVIVNNDRQQMLKKGRIIQKEEVRARIVRALRVVDDVYVSVDDGPGLDATFDLIRSQYPDTVLEFCNGGDRRDGGDLPAEEMQAAQRNDITLHYGVGGTEKADSSTRIMADVEAR